MFGTMCKSFHPGQAARNGMLAALLAARDFTSSERGIEAPRGFAHVMSTRFEPDFITHDLGSHYELARNMYKPYPCGLVIHAVIDGCLELRALHAIAFADVERVELRVNAMVLELTGKITPRTGLEGKFSVYHAAAVALVRGAGGEAQFSDEAVCDPAVVAVRERVNATADPAVGSYLEAYVTIVLRNGTVVERHVPHALGTLARPMSDADLEAKFRTLVEPILTPGQVDELIAQCWNVDNLDNVGVIGRAATVIA
jgi:2-methylcitrate dehydratase PrpD